MKMITLDWDLLPVGECQKRLEKINSIDLVEKVIYRVSANGSGYHVKVFLYVHVDFGVSMIFRSMWRDDPLRIKIDRERHKQGICTGVLFTEKDGKKAGEWHNYP